MLHRHLTPKRANHAKRLAECDTDTERKTLVLSTGQPHAIELPEAWMPCIGQFIIHGDGTSAKGWQFATQQEADTKARDLWRQWKKDAKKSS